LLHDHCDLGFNDERAAIFADTYANEEGGVSDEDIAGAKLEAQKKYTWFLSRVSKDEVCALSSQLVNAFPQKWQDWVK